ncbi:PorT family protein, partial [Paludibacteraceae bacterium OttesenSCG-928-F17]|nr:PorT family protein [Paludibacteraceae bacterium OttesenSCG-928-F17]
VSMAGAQGFDVGIKLGYNSSLSFSSLNSNLSYNYKNVFSEFWNGFQVGAYGRLYFNRIYVQPELLFSRDQREYTLTLDNGVGSYDNVVKINSIDIPLLAGGESGVGMDEKNTIDAE